MDINTYRLVFNGMKLEMNDQNYGSIMFNKIITINEFLTPYIGLFGRIVNVEIIFNTKISASKSIGILNSVKFLKGIVHPLLDEKKIKKLKIGNKVIEEDDNMSLSSLGIQNDFTCFVEEYEE